MLGVFRLDSMILVFSLIICCSTYVRGMKPDLLNKHRKGLGGFFRRCAVIGDRLSPLVSLTCLIMAFYVMFIR